MTLVLVDVDQNVRKLLDAYGLTERIAAANFYDSIQAAAAAFEASEGSSPQAPA